MLQKTIVRGGFAVLALMASVSAAVAQDRLLQEGKDIATGATIRVYKTQTGTRFDVVTPTVQLRKQLDGDRVVTSLAGGGERLVITLGREEVSVSGTRGKVSSKPTDEVKLERARLLIAGSPLVKNVTSLLGRMSLSDASPLQPLLLATRAFLLKANNDDSGVREMSEWVKRARARTPVIKTAMGGQRTPTDCWKAYGDELVEAWTDYVDCLNHIRWYTIFGEERCALVYEVRILGAFTWYASCVSLGAVIGK